MKRMLLQITYCVFLICSCTNPNTGSATRAISGNSDSDTITDNIVHLNDTISIAMVGDILPGNTYPIARLPKDDGHQLFRNVESLLKRSDIALGNLEGVLCTGGKSTNIGNPTGYSFRIPPQYVSLFVDAGFDFLNVANNHLRDFGPYGYEMTMHVLDSVGMAYAGLKGYSKYAVIERKSIRIGICAFGQNEYCYQHTTDSAAMRDILRELRPKCDIMIVSVHGGAEGIKAAHLPYTTEYYVGENRGNMRDFAHFCIDQGADLIWGHGPHVPRAVELYKGHLIAYSLGNFCTPFGMNINNMCGHAPLIIARVMSDGTFIDAQIHSFLQVSGDGPIPDSNNLAALDIKRLTCEDIKPAKLSISDTGTITIKTGK